MKAQNHAARAIVAAAHYDIIDPMVTDFYSKGLTYERLDRAIASIESFGGVRIATTERTVYSMLPNQPAYTRLFTDGSVARLERPKPGFGFGRWYADPSATERAADPVNLDPDNLDQFD